MSVRELNDEIISRFKADLTEHANLVRVKRMNSYLKSPEGRTTFNKIDHVLRALQKEEELSVSKVLEIFGWEDVA